MQVVDAFGTDYFNQKPNFTELIDASLYRCILSYAVSVRQCLLYHQVSINTIRHINVKPRQATTTILNVRVYIFVSDCHLGFGNYGGLG